MQIYIENTWIQPQTDMKITIDLKILLPFIWDYS